MKSILLRGLATVWMVLAATVTLAESADPAEALTDVLSAINSYQASFLQETTDADGRALQKSTGRMFAERPGRFRWEADAPFEQVMVSNGDQLMIHDVDLEQAVLRRLNRQLVNTPALLLSGDVAGISHAFRITQGVGTADESSFELRPRDPDSLFEAMRVQFRAGALQSMVLQDGLGQQTLITFQEIQLNEPLPGGLFSFDVPEGTDLIVEQ